MSIFIKDVVIDPYHELTIGYPWSKKGKCLWCMTPYADDGVDCIRCGAPKDINEIEAIVPMLSST